MFLGVRALPETAVFKVLWALLRPQTYFLMSVYVGLGIAYGLAAQETPATSFITASALKIASVFGALALWYIAGTAFNDYADYEIDKINLKKDAQRPLLRGLVSRPGLLKYGLGASAGSLVLAAASGSLRIAGLFVGLVLLNAAYSLKPVQISHRGGLAPLVLPLGYVVLTVCSGLFLTGASLTAGAGFLVGGMYLHFMARIVLKDHRDVKGDARAGKRTLVLRYGNRAVVSVALGLFVSSAVVLLITLRGYAGPALPFAIALAAAAAMVLLSLRNEERWPYQKPLITMFGRFCSGIITILITGLAAEAFHLNALRLKFTLVTVTALFFLSIFTIIAAQQPAASRRGPAKTT